MEKQTEPLLSEPWMKDLFIGHTIYGDGHSPDRHTTRLKEHPAYGAWVAYLRARLADVPELTRPSIAFDISNGATVYAARQMARFGVPKSDIEAIFLLLFGDKSS